MADEINHDLEDTTTATTALSVDEAKHAILALGGAQFGGAGYVNGEENETLEQVESADTDAYDDENGDGLESLYSILANVSTRLAALE